MRDGRTDDRTRVPPVHGRRASCCRRTTRRFAGGSNGSLRAGASASTAASAVVEVGDGLASHRPTAAATRSMKRCGPHRRPRRPGSPSPVSRSTIRGSCRVSRTLAVDVTSGRVRRRRHRLDGGRSATEVRCVCRASRAAAGAEPATCAARRAARVLSTAAAVSVAHLDRRSVRDRLAWAASPSRVPGSGDGRTGSIADSCRTYNALPDMPRLPATPRCPPVSPTRRRLPSLKETAMRCGGCGAKVGASVLTRALQRIDVPASPNVIVGLRCP